MGFRARCGHRSGASGCTCVYFLFRVVPRLRLGRQRFPDASHVCANVFDHLFRGFRFVINRYRLCNFGHVLRLDKFHRASSQYHSFTGHPDRDGLYQDSTMFITSYTRHNGGFFSLQR